MDGPRRNSGFVPVLAVSGSDGAAGRGADQVDAVGVVGGEGDDDGGAGFFVGGEVSEGNSLSELAEGGGVTELGLRPGIADRLGGGLVGGGLNGLGLARERGFSAGPARRHRALVRGKEWGVLGPRARRCSSRRLWRLVRRW